MSRRKNKFLLSVAGLCIALSVASIQARFPGQRLIILLVGLSASQSIMSRCVNIQSKWEQRATEQWEEIHSKSQKLLDAEAQFNLQKQSELLALQEAKDAFTRERQMLLVEVDSIKQFSLKEIENEREALARERQILHREAQSLEAKIQADLDAQNALLDAREKQLELTKQKANQALERKQKEILEDASNQIRETVDKLQQSQQRAAQQFHKELEKATKSAEIWKQRYLQADSPKLPKRRENLAEIYCEDYIFALWRYQVHAKSDSIKVGNSSVKTQSYETIKCDCDDRQPVDLATHFAFWLKLRDAKHYQVLKTDALREWCAIQTKTPTPYFVIEEKEGVIRCEIPQKHGYVPPKELREENLAKQKEELFQQKLKASEPPLSHFVEFLERCHQLALVGATGDGKTVLIGNILGVFNQVLGGSSELIVTNPKPSKGSTCLGQTKYKNFKTAIFGLLEVAVEIQYRLNINEKAIEQGREPPDHPPIIFFFDEYSQIASKWNSVNQDKFTRTVEAFAQRLDPARQRILEEIAEDISPKRFASELLRFCWLLGRSEKVKLLVSGQNLMPSVLGLNALDLWNAGFICLGDTVNWAFKARVYDWQVSDLKDQYQLRIEAAEKDPLQGFFGLYCPPKAKAYFAKNPAPNSYIYGEVEKPIFESEISVKNGDNSLGTLSAPSEKVRVELPDGELPENKADEDYSDSVTSLDPRNCFPEKDSYAENALWRELDNFIRNRRKKWAIENLLGKRGREYSEGVAYCEYLAEKYGQTHDED
ncbi:MULTISPECIES: hypothetical protein [unclassified Coleofasciculus]|uniref:hypothetical protein n=1 Tax=unclassified Coleofasciculus TaxID=2692782 RepID=UPI001880667C|nr:MULTISPECIES: hypothetical protein [unclassified Coleofasciculus]MBE9124740.1 hypothetical protein [Coleofasciculus sp. LEGE 07081]MBE9148192.1 hypothetical protein [Coleofasciculus sp. LEGE 07092]